MFIESFIRYNRLCEDYKTAKQAFLRQITTTLLGQDADEKDDSVKSDRTALQKEIEPTVDAAIAYFRQHQQQFQGDEKNIDWWAKQGWNTFSQHMRVTKTMQDKDFLTLRDDDEWLIIIPLNHQTSCYHGSGTDWCTTKHDREYFTNYFFRMSQNLPDMRVVLIYCIKHPRNRSTQEKWAMVPYFNRHYTVPAENVSYFDRADNSLTAREFESQTGLQTQELCASAAAQKEVIERARQRNISTDTHALLQDIEGMSDRKTPLTPTQILQVKRYLEKSKDTRQMLMLMKKQKLTDPWPAAERALLDDLIRHSAYPASMNDIFAYIKYTKKTTWPELMNVLEKHNLLHRFVTQAITFPDTVPYVKSLLQSSNNEDAKKVLAVIQQLTAHQ